MSRHRARGRSRLKTPSGALRGRRSDPAPFGSCFFCEDPLTESRVRGVFGTLAPGEAPAEWPDGLIGIELCGGSLPAIAVPSHSPAGGLGAQVLFMCCSHECATMLRLVMLADGVLRGEDPNVIAGKESSDESQETWIHGLKLASARWDRDEAVAPDEDRMQRVMDAVMLLRAAAKAPALEERLRRTDAVLGRLAHGIRLDQCCSWCFRTLERGDPIIPMYLRVKDPDRFVDREGSTMTMRLRGRSVLAHVPEGGSPASLDGDISFVLCSRSCEGEFGAAIEEGLHLSIVH